MTRRLGIISLCSLVVVGCRPPVFECENNRQCDLQDGGVCDPSSSACVYPDGVCPSEFRFGRFGGEFAHGCLPPSPSDVVVAWRQRSAVTLDGKLEEFERGAGVNLRSDFGVGATVWLSWDDDALYVAARVDDPHVESASYDRQPLWHNDGLELILDTGNDRAPGRIPFDDDFKFVVTALNLTGSSWGGVEPTEVWAGDIESATHVEGTLNQATDADQGYQLELRVAWDDVIRPPQVGDAWGLNLKVNDHFGASHRTVVWQTKGRFNHPSAAGTVVFADDRPVEVPATAEPRTSAPARFQKTSLLPALVRATPRALDTQPVERLFDGCIEARSECRSAPEPTDLWTLEFDLGEPRELGFVRVFGDDSRPRISTRWSLSTAPDPNGPWTSVLGPTDALGIRWFTQDVRGTSARHLRVSVAGAPGDAPELGELELFTRPPQ